MRGQDIEPVAHRYCFPQRSLEERVATWKRTYAEQEEGIRTVALLDQSGEILGYGSLLRRSEYFRDIPEVHDLWIDEGHRGQGLGSRLIGWLEELAVREGYTAIGIGVGLYRDYGEAQKLYFRLGYCPDGTGITYKNTSVTPGESYPVDDDLILWLRKALASSSAR
jgi:GNAT superfamily N-acetyltransferase